MAGIYHNLNGSLLICFNSVFIQLGVCTVIFLKIAFIFNKAYLVLLSIQELFLAAVNDNNKKGLVIINNWHTSCCVK